MSSYEVSRQVVAAIALIRNEEGKILIQRRNLTYLLEAYNKWEFPGGAVEKCESPYDAVRREVKEEIGCTVNVVRLLPYVPSNIWKCEDGTLTQAIVLCFECTIASGIPRPSNQEVAEVRWCSLTEAMEFELLPGNAEFIKLLS